MYYFEQKLKSHCCIYVCALKACNIEKIKLNHHNKIPRFISTKNKYKIQYKKSKKPSSVSLYNPSRNVNKKILKTCFRN